MFAKFFDRTCLACYPAWSRDSDLRREQFFVHAASMLSVLSLHLPRIARASATGVPGSILEAVIVRFPPTRFPTMDLLSWISESPALLMIRMYAVPYIYSRPLLEAPELRLLD